jgi:hypothetical protein
VLQLLLLLNDLVAAFVFILGTTPLLPLQHLFVLSAIPTLAKVGKRSQIAAFKLLKFQHQCATQEGFSRVIPKVIQAAYVYYQNV